MAGGGPLFTANRFPAGFAAGEEGNRSNSERAAAEGGSFCLPAAQKAVLVRKRRLTSCGTSGARKRPAATFAPSFPGGQAFCVFLSLTGVFLRLRRAEGQRAWKRMNGKKIRDSGGENVAGRGAASAAPAGQEGFSAKFVGTFWPAYIAKELRVVYNTKQITILADAAPQRAREARG